MRGTAEPRGVLGKEIQKWLARRSRGRKETGDVGVEKEKGAGQKEEENSFMPAVHCDFENFDVTSFLSSSDSSS